MPSGKGTYGSKVGRPPKKTGMKYKKTLTKMNGKKGLGKVKPMKNIPKKEVMPKKKKSVSLRMGVHKSRKGGLTAKGRAKYNKATGSKLKAPQPGGGPRKRSFCARMSGVKGPMKKPNGKPTRKALALKRWKC